MAVAPWLSTALYASLFTSPLGYRRALPAAGARPPLHEPTRLLTEDAKTQIKDSCKELQLATRLFVPSARPAERPRTRSTAYTFRGLAGNSWQELGLVRQVHIPPESTVVAIGGLPTDSWQELGIVREVRIRAPSRPGKIIDLPQTHPRKKKRAASPGVVKFGATLPELSPEVNRVLTPPPPKQTATEASPSRALGAALEHE